MVTFVFSWHGGIKFVWHKRSGSRVMPKIDEAAVDFRTSEKLSD